MGLLATTGRTVFRRLVAEPALVAAVALTVLVGMVQLASVPIYTDAVTVGALRRIVADAPSEQASVVVELSAGYQEYGDTDIVVSNTIAEATAPTGAEVSRRIRSSSFALPAPASEGDDEKVDLVVLATVEGIDGHTTLVDGAWPTDEAVAPSDPAATPDGPVGVAVEVAVAERLGLALGDVVPLTGRANDAAVEAEIVGRYRVDDRTDRFWGDDELLLHGFVDGQSFRTFGPLVVAEASILQPSTGRLRAEWHVEPQLGRLEVAQIDEVRRRLDNLPDDLTEALAASPAAASGTVTDAVVATQLPDLLAETSRSLTVTQSGVFAVVLQLAVLTGLALAMTGRLLLDARRQELDLLEARGAGRLQLITLSAVEASVLVVPAALAAPWIAAVLVDALGAVGPVGAIDLEIEPAVGLASYVTVAVAAAAMVIVLTWPAIRATRAATVSPLTRHRRQRRQAIASRSGLDIALLVVTALAFWQLNALGQRAGSLVGDRFSVDPILVVTPALALLAGAVLTLRLLPLVARAAERRVAIGRSLTVALASWQVARRPTGHGRPVFLLVMAFGIGVFASAYSSTWSRSQVDQAQHQVGADIRLAPNRRTNDSISDLHLSSAHEQLRGVTASMPVVNRSGPLPGTDLGGRFLLLDAGRASPVVQVRPDLAPGFDSSMDALVAGRPQVPGVELPAEPDRLEVVVTAEEAEIETDDGVLPTAFGGRLEVVVQDGNDLLHRIELGQVEVNGGPQVLAADLAVPLIDGSTARPAYPISIVDIEVQAPVPPPPSRTVTIELSGLSVSQAGGESVLVPLVSSSTDWMATTELTGGIQTRQSIAIEPASAEGAIRLAIESGATFEPRLAAFSLQPGATALPGTVPVVVSRSWLAESRVEIGESLQLPGLPLGGADAQVVGAVDGFPTIDLATNQLVIVDLPTVQVLNQGLARPSFDVDEQWLDLAPGVDEDGVVASLVGDPFDSPRVDGRVERQGALSSDPAALATIGAFTIGSIAAAVFAVVVVTVAAVMSARERRSEVTLLRALGLSPRQLGAWMAAEQVTLVVASLVLGTVIGLLLSATALPLISVGQQGEIVVPEALPVFPWATMAIVELTPVAVLGVILAALVGRLRRQPLAAQLRTGED